VLVPNDEIVTAESVVPLTAFSLDFLISEVRVLILTRLLVEACVFEYSAFESSIILI